MPTGHPSHTRPLNRVDSIGTGVQNGCSKHGSALMLYVVLCLLAAILGWVFMQAAHHTEPVSEPDERCIKNENYSPGAESRSEFDPRLVQCGTFMPFSSRAVENSYG